MASNTGKSEQKLVVLLSRIAEGEHIDLGENASALLKVDSSLVSQSGIRGHSRHLLAWTFHPVERFTGVDSVTSIQEY